MSYLGRIPCYWILAAKLGDEDREFISEYEVNIFCYKFLLAAILTLSNIYETFTYSSKNFLIKKFCTKMLYVTLSALQQHM